MPSFTRFVPATFACATCGDDWSAIIALSATGTIAGLATAGCPTFLGLRRGRCWCGESASSLRHRSDGYFCYGQHAYDGPPDPVCLESVVTIAAVGSYRANANAQVGEKEASAVAINPLTGDVSYCFDRPDRPMPPLYANQGYVKVQFPHFRDLERFCRSQGVVNDLETDHPDGLEADFSEARRRHEARIDRANAETMADRRELRHRGIRLPRS